MTLFACACYLFLCCYLIQLKVHWVLYIALNTSEIVNCWQYDTSLFHNKSMTGTILAWVQFP